MRAVAVTEFGGIPQLMDLPTPVAGAGEVLVRLKAAGVNPFDWKVIDGVLDGKMPHTFPLVLGIDGAGEVAEVGDGVTRFAPGDTVYGQFFHAPVGTGTFAEYVTVPEAQAITAAPANIRPALAAAVPTAGLAALALVEEAGIQRGQRVLIVGATGGVGSFTTQLAAARGAHVIATAGPDDVDRLRSYGAAEIVDHHAGPVAEQMDAGVDTLLDVVSDAATFADLAALVHAGGAAASTVGAADVDALATRGIRGVNINARASAERLDLLRSDIDAGRLRVPVTAEVPLEDAPDAIARSRAGHAGGKTVIVL